MMGIGFLLVAGGAFCLKRWPHHTAQPLGRRDIGYLAVLAGAIMMGAQFAH